MIRLALVLTVALLVAAPLTQAARGETDPCRIGGPTVPSPSDGPWVAEPVTDAVPFRMGLLRVIEDSGWDDPLDKTVNRTAILRIPAADPSDRRDDAHPLRLTWPSPADVVTPRVPLGLHLWTRIKVATTGSPWNGYGGLGWRGSSLELTAGVGAGAGEASPVGSVRGEAHWTLLDDRPLTVEAWAGYRFAWGDLTAATVPPHRGTLGLMLGWLHGPGITVLTGPRLRLDLGATYDVVPGAAAAVRLRAVLPWVVTVEADIDGHVAVALGLAVGW